MPVLTRGANAPLNSDRLELAVAGVRQGTVDLMVFQLGADRKVRSDADFVFFNQPSSPEGAVRLAAADRLTVDLTAVPASVYTLAVAVALDGSVGGSLAAIGELAVSVTGGADEHRAAADGLTVERAAVLVEIYRRAGAWKIRNVSAGWTGGLVALATEHGVAVDTEPAPEASPAAAPPRPAPAPPRSPAPPRYTAPAAPASGGAGPRHTGGPLPTSVSVVPPGPGQWPTPAPDPLSPPPYPAPVRTGGAPPAWPG